MIIDNSLGELLRSLLPVEEMTLELYKVKKKKEIPSISLFGKKPNPFTSCAGFLLGAKAFLAGTSNALP
jgi:hypothetical protein